jgi:hypothetical protein
VFRSRIPALATPAVLSASAVTLAATSPAEAAVPTGPEPIAGFTEQNAAWQRQYEKRLSAIPSAMEGRALDTELAARPGLATTTGDRNASTASWPNSAPTDCGPR